VVRYAIAIVFADQAVAPGFRIAMTNNNFLGYGVGSQSREGQRIFYAFALLGRQSCRLAEFEEKPPALALVTALLRVKMQWFVTPDTFAALKQEPMRRVRHCALPRTCVTIEDADLVVSWTAAIAPVRIAAYGSDKFANVLTRVLDSAISIRLAPSSAP
jgi:hypothetical protein